MQTEFRDQHPSNSETPTDQRVPTAAASCSARQSTDNGTDITQLARILHRRRRFIVTAGVVGAMLAGVTGLVIAPRYTATAQLVVDVQQDAPIGGAADVFRPTDLSSIDTHVTMLTSNGLVHRVLDSLSDHPDSAATPPQASTEGNLPGAEWDTANRVPEPAETANARLSLEELRRRLNIWLDAIAGRVSAENREFDDLVRGLKVIQERTSRVISVSFTTKSPERAAAVVNRLVQLYVKSQAEQMHAQANQELAALDERAAALKGELDRTNGIIQTLLLPQSPPAIISSEAKETDARLRTLEREAAASSQAYAGVLQRQKDIRDGQETAAPDVHVLSLASVPDRPSSVNPMLFIFPALIASLIGASLLVVLLEQLDQGLRNEREVADAIGLPCIGLLPRLPRFYARRPSRYLLDKPFTPYTEAIRSAFATLNISGPLRGGATTILVSSSVPGEGKTTTAVSLCVYAAQLGRRALLVDFDLRHPSTLRMLYGRSATPTPRPNADDDTPESRIQHLTDLNLDYLPMSNGSHDPLALFAGKHMHHFLRQLAHNYDCVVIDSPPLLGVTETRLLAALVDSVVFVVKWGSTRREMARNAASVLHDAVRSNGGSQIRVVALVSQVNLKRHASYRYGDVGEALARFKKYYFGAGKA